MPRRCAASSAGNACMLALCIGPQSRPKPRSARPPRWLSTAVAGIALHMYCNGIFRTSEMDPSTAKSTWLRPVHCIAAITGEPRTMPVSYVACDCISSHTAHQWRRARPLERRQAGSHLWVVARRGCVTCHPRVRSKPALAPYTPANGDCGCCTMCKMELYRINAHPAACTMLYAIK